jgi:hypothetical protein
MTYSSIAVGAYEYFKGCSGRPAIKRFREAALFNFQDKRKLLNLWVPSLELNP